MNTLEHTDGISSYIPHLIYEQEMLVTELLRYSPLLSLLFSQRHVVDVHFAHSRGAKRIRIEQIEQFYIARQKSQIAIFPTLDPLQLIGYEQGALLCSL